MQTYALFDYWFNGSVRRSGVALWRDVLNKNGQYSVRTTFAARNLSDAYAIARSMR